MVRLNGDRKYDGGSPARWGGEGGIGGWLMDTESWLWKMRSSVGGRWGRGHNGVNAPSATELDT